MDTKWILGVLVVFLAIVAITAIGFNVMSSEKTNFDDALVVNGEKISMAEVRTAYLSYEPAGPFISEEVILTEVVDGIVNYHLLVQEATKRGLTVEPAEIDQVISNTLRVNGIPEDQKEVYFQNTGTDLVKLELKIKNDLLVNKIVLDTFEGADVTQEEIVGVYQDNIAQLMVPEFVSVRQIFISKNLHSEDEFLNITQEVVDRLRTEDFCLVSETYSDSPDNCTVYEISKGTVFPDYETVAFAQAVGAASLIQSEQGNHIVQTVNKQNFNPVPLSDVNQTIGNTLTEAKRRDAYVQLITELRKNAVITNNLQ